MENLIEAAANDDREGFQEAFNIEMLARIQQKIADKQTEIVEAYYGHSSNDIDRYKLPQLDPWFRGLDYIPDDPSDTPEQVAKKAKKNEKILQRNIAISRRKEEFVHGAKFGRVVGRIAGVALGATAGAFGGAVAGAVQGAVRGNYYGGRTGDVVGGSTEVLGKSAVRVGKKIVKLKDRPIHSPSTAVAPYDPYTIDN